MILLQILLAVVVIAAAIIQSACATTGAPSRERLLEAPLLLVAPPAAPLDPTLATASPHKAKKRRAGSVSRARSAPNVTAVN